MFIAKGKSAGSGGNPLLGEQAAEESKQAIAASLKGSDLVFITARTYISATRRALVQQTNFGRFEFVAGMQSEGKLCDNVNGFTNNDKDL
ncbi:hypothetical protein RHMOL_Rhmol08G0168700 [Rhododendron molle]|uniref:Uncharacterized protein n=4 Tax=Rhododendron molle TaxID=49168 RepID=A0ACC0MQH5_RHOML|nr:hypothetical protein RHMOL_Rhmol08G0168700 [Rhododendron molle]KAI8542815.1 hypothetical protein RHMOL_Rhmol08G0168700 [Rhododendron molle]KAI8542816.1 hypothetical protein RHMOL_Rhmol08G0168700 [Rhododendron molle]KAI8542817.1 hypothetical protein RHMOL_Rhmol08G0168700 [Rhododendron molle]